MNIPPKFTRKKPKPSPQTSTTMSTGEAPTKREPTPSNTPSFSSIPQKRALEETDHAPTVSSPLNPDFKAKQEDGFVRERIPRTKKDSLKKRESKGGSLAPDSNGRATPDPKGLSRVKKEEAFLSPVKYQILPSRLDFDPPRGPTFLPSHTIIGPDGAEIQFYETTDHVLNKKKFSYTLCIADPAFPHSLYYRHTEVEPYGPRLSFEDTPTHMRLDESGRHITTNKGWRMAKANVGVREGRWYWECKITRGISKRKRSDSTDTDAHVRMGWARREAPLDAPVGFDAYSYGLRDVAGQKMWMSRPKDFFPKGEDINTGDVIGFEINLPSESLHRKVVDGSYNPAVDFGDDEEGSGERSHIIRDRVPTRFKTHAYFEKVEYASVKELEELMHPSPLITSTGGLNGSGKDPGPTHAIPSLRTLPHSYIKVYKNGQLMGTPFKDLLAFLPLASKPSEGQVAIREGLDDGTLGYYPAVSVFRGGAAELNFGPNFWFPPPELTEHDTDVDMKASGQLSNSNLRQMRAIEERYNEQIAEDIVYDIVDEVDFWMQNGGVSGTGATNGARAISFSLQNGTMPVGEIKELVQDDE